MTPTVRTTSAQFGETHRKIVKSGRPGPYRISETPWARKIFSALDDESPYREIYCPKGTQLGFTEIGLIWIGRGATMGRSSLIIEPTESTAKKIAKTKWREFIRGAKPLRELFKGRSADTTLHFSAPSVDVIFAGSNSPANFASITMQMAMADDYDRWAEELLKEGDPLTALLNRLAVAGFMGKLFVPSSPTLADRGIWPRWLLTDQQHFHTPCPKCGHQQHWEWKHMDRPKGRPDQVVLVCRECASGSTEFEWKTAWVDGGWVPHAKAVRPDIIGLHLNSLYSMYGVRTWDTIAAEYEGYEVLGQESNFHTFDNTTLGLPKKQGEGAVPVDELRRRLEEDLLRGIIPEGGLVLVAAIDYQDNRLEVFFWAFARNNERWVVDHIVIPRLKATPEGRDTERSARELADDIHKLVLDPMWPHALGGELAVDMVVHDTADRPTSVYDVIDLLPSDRNIGSRGVQGQGKQDLFIAAVPKDISQDGKVVKRGRLRMTVNTFPAKEQWYADLRLEPGEDGRADRYIHIPGWVDETDGLLAQFVAEELRVSSRKKQYWHKTGRNEALDCGIMADAGRFHLKTHLWPEDDWKGREARVTWKPAPAEPVREETQPQQSAQGGGDWIPTQKDWLG